MQNKTIPAVENNKVKIWANNRRDDAFTDWAIVCDFAKVWIPPRLTYRPSGCYIANRSDYTHLIVYWGQQDIFKLGL